MALRLRRGTDAERQTITPREGELIYTTDTKEVYIGDGTTQGGNLISAELLDDTSPSLGGNLDLNGNNITGTGNIDINGTITASGNINLGDGSEDNVIVGGQISSHLIPKSNADFDLGSPLAYWRHTYSYGATIDGQLQTETLMVGDIVGNDSTLIYSTDTGQLDVESIRAQTIDADLTGSVFGEDSLVVVDAISRSLYGNLYSDTIFTNDGDFGLKVISKEGDSFQINHYKGDQDSPQAYAPGDTIGALSIKGYNGFVYKFAAGLGASFESDADLDTELPNSTAFLIAGDNSSNGKRATLDSKGTFSADVFKPGSYADETARDAAITNPQAGMIIFLAGHDDSSGSPKFQGYDGTKWVDLN